MKLGNLVIICSERLDQFDKKVKMQQKMGYRMTDRLRNRSIILNCDGDYKWEEHIAVMEKKL